MFNWLFGKKRPAKRWALDTPLFRWDKSGHDVFSIGDSYCGLLCTGMTGSAKSSTTGEMVAISQLAAGYGGLILSVKPERERWMEYCRRTGRSDDLRIVDASCGYTFNFLDELQNNQGEDAGLSENVVSLIHEIGQLGANPNERSGSQGDNQFFERASKVLVRNAVDLLTLAGESLSVASLCAVVSAMPRSVEQLASESWRQSNFVCRLLERADKREKSPRQRRDNEAVVEYVFNDYVRLHDRTRSSITATLSSVTDLWQRGLLYDLHSRDTTLSPRHIDDGAVILVDLPLVRYGAVGLNSQLVWKLMAQRWLERRAITPETRPAFIHIDECQFFCGSHTDALFATTCRAARVSYTLLTQSISGLETAFGSGPAGKALAEQLCANMCTKILHATSDSATAEWGSQLCGKSYRMLANSSSQHGEPNWSSLAGIGQPQQSTMGMGESLQYDVEPREFSYLRTGGKANNWLADAIVIRSGKIFRATGNTYMRATFRQRFS